MDYTKKDGCYSKELINGDELLTIWFEDTSISRDQYIKNILELIAPAFIRATALPKFERTLMKQKTKVEVCTYCYNTILCGCGLGVN